MPSTPRHASEVCDQLLDVIPIDELQLRADIKDAKSTGQYQPPESHLAWLKIQNAFTARFMTPHTMQHLPEHPEWEDQCIAIIQGRQ